jgi:rare lipoprotein A
MLTLATCYAEPEVCSVSIPSFADPGLQHSDFSVLPFHMYDPQARPCALQCLPADAEASHPTWWQVGGVPGAINNVWKATMRSILPICSTPALVAALALSLVACSTPKVQPTKAGGRYYLNDGPPNGVTQAQIDAVKEPVPKAERLVSGTLKPYVAMGNSFRPMNKLMPYHARGVASWYGTRYHGLPTASGELYDVMKLTAAHPLLPIPSYVRVTNVENGRTIIVRVNDRGPFLSDRIIDLSYVAAAKLGYAAKGRALVEIDVILP